jgi:hypothetical protein
MSEEELKRIGAMCFNCHYWAGKIKKQKGYCYKWNLSGSKDAPEGTFVCTAWEKRKNAKLKP